MDVGAWLRGLGLGQYEQAFRDNDVDADVLPELTADDLIALGITSVGHRRKLLAATAALRDGPAPSAAPSPAEPAPGAPPAAHSGDAERRQLTVMFVDLVGSTALAAGLDPEEMAGALRAYQNAVAGEVARFEGHVAKFMGDGVLAYFGWPRAHEDEPERAVRAGLAVVAAVRALQAPVGERLSARVGIATGLVMVGEVTGKGEARERSVVGDTPNLAARLQALAPPDGVVVAPATRRLLGALFELQELEPHPLKGLAEPVAAFAVLGERAGASRFEARGGHAVLPMEGRDQELALLLERWSLAKAGKGQGVLLVGEAGIGKSRITRALMDAVAAEPHLRVRLQCSPYHADSALWPVVEHLRRAAGFTAEDTPDEQLDKLEALLRQGSADITGSARLLADLLGLDAAAAARYGRLELSPQARRTRTLQALADELVAAAAHRPALVVVEDAHWLDPSTLELTELYLDRSAAAPVLILLTSRPDRQPALAAHPHVTRLTLNRLGRAGAEAIIAGLSGGKALPPEVVDAIVARTDGVPLYVEEVTKAVLEAGAAGELRIPASLHDSLMARLDRIPEVKEVAQTAACIGRVFDYPLLAAVVDRPEPELVGALDKLAAAELVFRRGVPPEASYTFKHALVRDAAYESLLRSRRQVLHRRIAEALEERSPVTPPEVLAYHAAEAGLADKAADLWQRAGEAALARPAYAEAASHFASAIALVERTPGREAQERELALQVQRGQALIAAKGYAWPGTVAAFERARELAEALGDTPLLPAALYGDWVGRYVRADFPSGLYRAEAFLAAAERVGDVAARLVAHRVLGTSHMIVGELGHARHHLERALALYRPDEHAGLTARFGHEPSIGARCYLAWTAWLSGHPDRAAVLCAEAEAAGRGVSHVNTLAYLHFHVAVPALLARRTALVEVHGRALGELAREHGLALWKAYATFFAGCCRAPRGEAGATAAMARGWPKPGLPARG